jgi:hypothetical protein
MSSAHITIAGKKHAVQYRLGTIYAIAKHFKAEPSGLLEIMQSTDTADVIELSAVATLYGLKTEAKNNGKKAPFDSVDMLLDSVDSLTELRPAVECFTEAFMKCLGLNTDTTDTGEAEGNAPGVQPNP